MAKQKSTQNDTTHVLQALYDMLMYDIEPELVTEMLPELPEIYANETEEEREERAERYARAFSLFSESLGDILALWKDELVAFRNQAFASFKEKSRQEDAEHLSDIEHSIDEQ
jgi:hypothetical protein